MRIAADKVFTGLTNVHVIWYTVFNRWTVERTCTAPEGRPRVGAARDFSVHLSLYRCRKGGEKMDVNTIMQLVTTLGFPIVCCIALFWRMIKSDENHKEEMEKLSEALNNNTLAINKLNERLNHGEN